MFFLLEWNIRNQRHDKSLSVYTHFLLTLRAVQLGTYMTDIEEHWKLYLSASNNMNYYNFTKQTTHKCILQSRPDPNEKIWYGKKIPYHQSYLRVPYRMFETEKEIWLYSILSYHFCTIISVCTLPAPRKTDINFRCDIFGTLSPHFIFCYYYLNACKHETV